VRFYDALLHHVYRESHESSMRLSLHNLLRCSATTTEVEVEWCTVEGRRLDLLIRAYSTSRKLTAVVGIENKHWAEEQSGQIAAYQQEMSNRFPDVFSVLLFLAPSRRLPKTANSQGPCLCVPCTYKSVVAALFDIEPESEGQTQLLVRSLRDHFEKSLTGGDSMSQEVKRLVEALYQNGKHRLAIRHIMENLPTFSAIADRIVDSVLERLAEETFEIAFYPQNKTRLQEIKLRPECLRSHTDGYTLTYMLHADRRGRSSSTPDVGDVVTVQLLASCSSPETQQRVREMKLATTLPPSKSTSIAWGSWVAVWAGETYQLQDLGEADVENCARIVIDAINATLPRLKDVFQNEINI
jgi:hypothetical protein